MVNKLDSKRGEHKVFIIHEVNYTKGTKFIPKGLLGQDFRFQYKYEENI